MTAAAKSANILGIILLPNILGLALLGLPDRTRLPSFVGFP
jgi:hypothetical protein